ncbi:hypothetical protein ABQ137_08330 [Xanthomonas sp. WHRI 8393]|uniref:hypothetical protein n=1 Tax=Xanthomonas sp. WHRI 8393 TaxID=3161574 RepID=UPI0032E8D307
MTVSTFLTLLVLGTAVLVAFAVNRADRLRNQREVFGREFDRFYFRRQGALAVSIERSRLKIRVGRTVKIYPLMDVRSWEKHWHNSRREGTITVSVRDVDHPVWTIKFGSEREMNQWYEILSQAINEGEKL